jgi:phosphoribosyl 1,2-cyclic phosphate phosphodiesterase
MDKNKLKVVILGSGTSTGVPVISCSCSICKSEEQYNKRLRSSLLVIDQDQGQNILIDTSPDMRQQLLQQKIDHLDHVLFTHTHADHLHGFDDLRAVCFRREDPLTCWLEQEHFDDIKKRFSYLFQTTGYSGTKASLKYHIIRSPSSFHLGPLEVEHISLPHGHTTSTAYRMGSFAYATDFKSFPEEYVRQWQGKIQVMVASGLHFETHHSHSSISETIELFRALEVKKGIITHLSHKIDYQKDSKKLPKNISLAYDGMVLHI